MNESKFSAWVCKWLRDNGWHVQRIETSTGAGVPDINCCKHGEDLWIENKCSDTPYPVLRPMQYAWLWKRQRVGGMCIVLNYCKKDERIYLYHVCAHMPTKTLKSGQKLLDYNGKFTKQDFKL